ncbi:protease inhibitor Inh/omp19 family protein [Fulvimarina pelagi]|nr:protease inhibitor Inh/omp19 family protein [Fulvimarina pelagi]
MANNATNGDQNGENGDTQVAALDPNAGSNASSSSSGGGGSLSRNKVLGAYKVTTAGGNCQIILSLTKWSGGYRAASRGCPGAVADVSAWDVSGSNVVLRNSGGSQVASLSSTGDSRYDGQTQGGQAISLYR